MSDFSIQDDSQVFTTSKGVKVSFLPVSVVSITSSRLGLIERYREKGLPIDPPTYKVKSAGGLAVDVPHTKESVAQTTDDPDLQWKWEEHLRTLTQANKELSMVWFQTILEDCVTLPLPEDDSWVKKEEARFIKVPDDPHQKWLHWLIHEVFLERDYRPFIKKVVAESAKGTGREEQVKAALASFPD